MKNVFTIEPHAAFLDTLAQELWQRNNGDGFRLSETLVLLPTRRACRHLGAAFTGLAKGKPVLLPRMRPLGDIDEDEIIFAEEEGFDVLPAITPLKRLMLLTQQVQRRDPAMSCDQAALAAEALARFLDQIQIEQCDIRKLPTLVENRELAKHWQQTVEFLRIVTKYWPDILADHGCIDPALRRNAVLAAQTALWRKQPPAHPVIAAGSTGSVPATAELLDIIASLPQGAVILPGLDRDMDDLAWKAIDDTHPQHGLKRLLEKMNVERQTIRDWGVKPPASPRSHLIRESMRPAKLTEAWRGLRGKMERECAAGLTRLTLDHPQEEARVIALRLRALLETPHETAAFVTADRSLGARVASLLRRWGVEVDDSGGAPLATLPTGAFLNLTLAAASPRAGNVDILALLKHPLAACGQYPAACRTAARESEIRLRNNQEEKFSKVKNLVESLTATWHEQLPLMQRIDLHIRIAEAIAASNTETGASRLWRERGADIATWLDEWRESAEEFPALTGEDYRALFGTLAASKTLRTTRATHSRLAILGPLEARLISADLIILGGMNEGVWPPDAGFDPWMSRPMRRDFGLPSPEFRVGLSAHDFAHLANAKQVMITRSLRSGGTPTTPSRFLLQIEAVLRAAGISEDRPDARWQEWAQMLDKPERIQPCEHPQPRPPVNARPTTLSVTEISTWQRNPYAIYARHVLGLKKLEELDAELDASDRGNMIHNALEKFVRAYPDSLPPNSEEKLLAIGHTIFADEHDTPQVQAFWWARFVDIAAWFIDNERARRDEGIKLITAEGSGRIVIGGLTLKGRADRIDRLTDGTLTITDYKTGGVPTKAQIESGIEPQLQLLALIAGAGGFTDIAPAKTGTLEYWNLKGGRGGCKIDSYADIIPDLIAKAETGLKNLIAEFANPETPYEAVPKPHLKPKYNDYAHLSRLAEWGRTLEDE